MNSRARGQFSGLRPAELGNDLATTHGAKVSAAKLARDPRTLELAEQIRASMPVYSPADDVTVQLLALTLRRIERAAMAVERVDDLLSDNALQAYATSGAEYLRTLREDLRKWIALSASLAGSLGLNPLSRSRLGLNIAQTEAELMALREQGRQVRERAELRLAERET